jgi:DNA repair exonuclease SbcCD ATPase subunit
MDSMKTYMIDEEAKRLAISHEQLELQQKAGKLIEHDKMVISEKVKTEIKTQLEAGAHSLIQVEKERDRLKTKAIESQYLIAELDGLVQVYHQEEERNRKEVDLQREMIDNLKTVVSEMQHHIDLKDGEISEKDDQIRVLKNEVDDLKGVVFKLNDVRLVLNRVFEPYQAQ